MTTETNNGSRIQRRSLNDTIGRLDAMIDGLSDAIPGTIRDTLQESIGAAVSEGVRAALVEIMANPEVLALVRGSMPAATPHKPSAGPRLVLVRTLATRVGDGIRQAAQWCREKVQTARATVVATAYHMATKVATLCRKICALRHVHNPVMLAFFVGSLAATAALFTPNWFAAALSGLGGACATMAVQVGLWVRQSYQTLIASCD
jgi:hypothetical protein